MVLKELQKFESVAFLEPISLKRLLTDGEIAALFLGLHFTKDSRFQWRNNYGHTYEDAVRIIDFMVELKGKTHAALGAPPFLPVRGDHYSSTSEAWADLDRCLDIITYGKKNAVQVRIQELKDNQTTPYTQLFYSLAVWTEKTPKMALLRFIAMPTGRKHKISVEEVYMRREWWENEVFIAWIDILRQRQTDQNFISKLLLE